MAVGFAMRATGKAGGRACVYMTRGAVGFAMGATGEAGGTACVYMTRGAVGFAIGAMGEAGGGGACVYMTRGVVGLVTRATGEACVGLWHMGVRKWGCKAVIVRAVVSWAHGTCSEPLGHLPACLGTHPEPFHPHTVAPAPSLLRHLTRPSCPAARPPPTMPAPQPERDPGFADKALGQLKKNQKVVLMCAIGGTLDTLVRALEGDMCVLKSTRKTYMCMCVWMCDCVMCVCVRVCIRVLGWLVSGEAGAGGCVVRPTCTCTSHAGPMCTHTHPFSPPLETG